MTVFEGGFIDHLQKEQRATWALLQMVEKEVA